MTRIEALQCPACGAPLELDGHAAAAVCVYCNASLLVTRDAHGHGELAPDEKVPHAVVQAVKEMLLLGNREQAVEYFRSATGRSEEAVRVAVDGYAGSIVAGRVSKTTVNRTGMVVILGAATTMVLGIKIATTPTSLGLGVLLAIVGGLVLMPLTPAFFRTLGYLRAAVGIATIKRHAYIGALRNVHSYRLWLEVQGADGVQFETELPFLVRETGRSKIQCGHRFKVKYFPGRPESVLFHRHLTSNS